MKVDNQEVERIAGLAKLQFEGEEKETIKADMNRILTFIEKLDELDTDNVEPLLYMTDEVNHLREDDVTQEVTQQEALKNAPSKDSDYFKVPKVLKK